jgi:iron complex outermembrane receptor protein
LIAALLVSAVAERTGAQAQSVDLGHASLEELMNMRITTAGRREQRAVDAAAAVFVITHEDIRRSGLTSIPELLRLVPGVQVARINGGNWAISVRGFNGLYSNKLLVLVDGRSSYNRLFSGVFWDLEDLVLEDIDRIEVVRGPGAAEWGANAVNGVINIVTRGAADTQGALVRVAGGTFDRGLATARYGGTFGSTSYRVFTRWSAQGESELPGGGADDTWRRGTAGFRTDRAVGLTALTLEGVATRGEANALWRLQKPLTETAPAGDPISAMNTASLLARWTGRRASGASLQIQSSLEITQRREPIGDYRRRVADADFEYHSGSTRHDVVAGGGYRFDYERFAGRAGYSLIPDSAGESLANVFAEDQIAIAGNRLHVTLGARIEHDGSAGWGLQPTARLMTNLPRGQHLWAATSRALRTPSMLDHSLRLDLSPDGNAGPLPVSVTISGNAATRNEELTDIEAGYRAEIGRDVTIAVTAFAGRYQHLRTSEPGDPTLAFSGTTPYIAMPMRFANLGGADTSGIEMDAQWAPLAWWRVDGSFTGFHLTPRSDARSGDAAAAVYDGDAPARQWQLHSAWSLGTRAAVDARLFRVGRLRNLGIDAYTRADVRVELPLTRALTAAFAGQNLLTGRHTEFNGASAAITSTLVPRSAHAQLTWRF